MNVKLIGVRPVSFPDKNTGEIVEGISLFIAYPDPDVIGLFTEKIFINLQRLKNLKVNVDDLTALLDVSDFGDAEIDIDYNPRKQICGISICQ